MKLSVALCGLLLLLLLVAAVNCSPVTKREAVDDLSPLNEVYVLQTDDDDEGSVREKRKIGVVKLGVSNGIINFVFGKLDAFLDAKTKALTILDESNRAKNAAFEIDNTKSATGEFINKFLAQKSRAGSSIGPIFNAGSTFLSTAKQGLAGAFASKLAPLSSLSGGLVGGLSGGSGGGDGSPNGGGGGSNSGSFLTGILGSLSGGSGGGNGGLGSLSNSGLSGNNNGAGDVGGNGVDELEPDFPGVTADANANAGYGNLAGGYSYTPPHQQQYNLQQQYYTYGR